MDIVQFLLEKGAKVDLADEKGRTPLWTATKVYFFSSLLFQFNSQPWLMNQNGHFEIVELLLAKGAEVDRADCRGSTPLWTASEVCVFFFLFFQFNSQPRLMNQNGHLETVELLLAKGANTDQVNQQGRTPLWIAVYVWIYYCFSSYRVCVCFFVFKNSNLILHLER